MEEMRVAAVCMRSRPGAIEENLERMEALAGRAAEAGAEILCFPEFSVTGYVLKDPQGVYSGLTYDAVLDRLIRMAREYGIVVLAGVIEPSRDGRPAIGQVVAGPEGIMGVHRKTHLSPPEKAAFRPGNRMPVFRWKEKVFGIQLCYESHFPEISTMMALNGADILFMPHASPRGTPEEKLESWLRHLTGRAFDNALFIVACNAVGESPGGFPFPGVIVFLGPDGRVVKQHLGESEHLLPATLDFSFLKGIRRHRMKYFLPYRRPDIYGPLSDSSS
ncbi:MAG: nitrilase-related carbon-nitrogen hydrolase [Desulfatiglandales bacterium]